MGLFRMIHYRVSDKPPRIARSRTFNYGLLLLIVATGVFVTTRWAIEVKEKILSMR